MDHRSTHYSLWFVFFGVINALSNVVDKVSISPTAIWFLVTGALGLIFASKKINEGKLSRPYDIIVGIIFALAGVIGILMAFKVHLLTGTSGIVSGNSVLGLNISSFFLTLVYAVLGFTSLNHGLKSSK